MRLLAISDPHGDYTQIPRIIEAAEDVDLVLIAGDITNFGPDEMVYQLLEILEPLASPVLAIPGNCDHQTILTTLDASRAINLESALYTIGDTTFIGIGGSNPTPFDTPFERSEEELGVILNDLLDRASQIGGRTVLLSHAPPKNTLDQIPGGNAGSDAIARAIGKLDLIVCGHIHEDQGVAVSDGTTIVNVGQASMGCSAVITIDRGIVVRFNNV